MRTLTSGLVALTALTSLAACTTDQYGNRRLNDTGRGAAIGAAAGAGVAAITGGNVLTGAAIGAAGGAVIGAVSSDRNRYNDREGRRTYYDNNGNPYHYDRDGRRVRGPW